MFALLGTIVGDNRSGSIIDNVIVSNENGTEIQKSVTERTMAGRTGKLAARSSYANIVKRNVKIE